MTDTRHYCTLLDAHYLARAVALYRSLERHERKFRLDAVCMDWTAQHLLGRLALPHLRIVPIADIEAADPQLRAVRPDRARHEYCWTCTPAVCRYILASEPGLELLTYLDADLHLSSSSDPLFAELGAGSMLLVPHRGSADIERNVGIYNVGWVTFRNDQNGRAALDWWRNRCLEWCFDRMEPDRFGDQKYLDDWPIRFAGVRVSSSSAAGLAPWNQTHHAVTNQFGEAPPLVDGRPLIYFHHSGVRLHRATRPLQWLARRGAAMGQVPGAPEVVYRLASEPSSAAVDQIWARYVAQLGRALNELAGAGAKPGLGLDSGGFRIMLKSLAAGLPSPVANAYLRLPLRARHRIWRWFAPARA